MKELIWVRVQYASRQQCCKTHKRPLHLPLDVDLRIILKYVLNGMGCMDWINLAVYQDKRQTVLNIVMKL